MIAPSRVNSTVLPAVTAPRVWRPAPSTAGLVLKVTVDSFQLLLDMRWTVPPAALAALTPRRRRAWRTWRPFTPLTAKRRYVMRTGEASARRIVEELKLVVAEPPST